MVPELEHLPVQRLKFRVRRHHPLYVPDTVGGYKIEPGVQLSPYTSIVATFAKDVKRNYQVLLQQIQLEPGAEDLF